MNPNRIEKEYLPLFIEHNQNFYEQLDMTLSPMVLDWDEPSADVKDAFTQFSPDGFATIVMDLHNSGGKSPEPHVWKGMPVMNLLNPVNQIVNSEISANIMSAAIPLKYACVPSFYFYRIVWSSPFQVINTIEILK